MRTKLNNLNFSVKVNNIKTTAEVITESLIDMIHNVKLKPGQQLSQEGIAKMFGVSRVPVRDALQNIVNIGLAEKVPRKGIIVSPIDREILKNLYDVRRLLEGNAIQLVIMNRYPGIIEVLKNIILKQIKAMKEKDRSGAMQLNEGFHSNLYSFKTTKNKILNDLIFYNRLRITHAKNVSLCNGFYENNVIKNSPSNHQKIVDKIEKGSVNEAKELIIEIINQSEKKVFDNLNRMNFFKNID